MSSVNKCTAKFVKEVLCLFLSIRKVNFAQLGRYAKSSEQRFRQNFEKSFDWLSFNTAMVKHCCDEELVIALDPSFVSKSGKKTPGIGYFWSGCAASFKRGLEFCGLAAIDLVGNTAMHLLAIQTIPNETESLLEFYARCITDRAEQLLQVSKVIVADAYFSKESFVTPLTTKGFSVVSRFRGDVSLQYIIEKQLTGKPGRPVTVGGKVDLNDLSAFTPVGENGYTAVVRANALKLAVRVVILFNEDHSDRKIYFSTDTKMSAEKILQIYSSRFQIEFLYRDGKQHTSLSNCQARSVEKLDFHFNSSLTSLNVAKAQHWYRLPPDQRGAFSMATIKTINHNKLLLERFIDVFAISPNKLKNIKDINELIYYGTQSA